MGASVTSEDIYEALFDEEAFGRLPQLLAQASGARSALLHWEHRDGSGEALGFCRFTPESIESYVKDWAAHDPWFAAGAQPCRLNKVFLAERAVPSVMFAKSAIYNDFIRSQLNDDTFHCMCAVFSTPWGEGGLGVQRGRTEAPFGDADLATLQGHTRDLGRVLRVRGELAAARRSAQTARDALDVLDLCIMVVCSSGRLMEANAAAAAVLARADGFTSSGGSIRAKLHPDDVTMQAAIAQATAPGDPRGTSLTVDRGPDEAPYLVSVTPLIAASVSRLAMVIFRDPEAEDVCLTDRVRALFGLSKVEALVAVELSKGFSPVEIAARRGVQTSTLKTQLASIMEKMGCARQAEIAATVARLPPIRSS